MTMKAVSSLFKLNKYGECTGTRGHPFKLCKKTVLASQYALLFVFCTNTVTELNLLPRLFLLLCSHSKQWNSLPSDICQCHIQSSHAFKTVLKTHLYHKFIQFMSVDFPTTYLPSLLLKFLLGGGGVL